MFLSCSTKSGAERLEVFTVYLQRYVLALKFVPLDLHFAVNDTLEKVPLKIRKLRSLEEACTVLRQLEGAPEVDETQRARERERAAAAKAEALTEAEKRYAAEEKRRALIEERRKRDEDERKQFDRELAAMMTVTCARLQFFLPSVFRLLTCALGAGRTRRCVNAHKGPQGMERSTQSRPYGTRTHTWHIRRWVFRLRFCRGPTQWWRLAKTAK